VNHVDLFSGIGGFSLAASRLRWRTVAFCEVDPVCVRIIERRFDNHRWLSMPGPIAGGKEGWTKRGEELAWAAPDWLVVENTYHRWRAWMPELRRQLNARGYSSLPLRVRAADVGARHLRARGWLVAHADGERLRELSRWWSGPGRQVATELAQSWDSAPRGLGANDGLPDWVDRRHALGNAIVPAAAELIFRGIQATC
jgi:DNA (cytosine-5)-methyltransferase 1